VQESKQDSTLEQDSNGPNWWEKSAQAALEELGSDPEQGLSRAEAERRLSEYGPNELIERGVKSVWKILWEQLTGVLVLVLIAAAAVSALLGDFEDAGAIVVIVILNAALGVRQEYRAEKAMAALKRLAVPVVKVIRDGRTLEVSAREVVPGDVVQLEAGGSIPADARLIEAVNLRVQEAALTGESEPVEKDASAMLSGETGLADRRNMVYMGTAATYGRGRALITSTGMNTELGRLADLLQSVEDEETPLQRKLDQLGRVLALAALGIVTVIFGLGLLRGEDVKLMFLTAVSLAVAAVPEGLPAVVTIALALGAQRMLHRNALIRKLPAVETLGSVTVICSDKTGTLTQNRMTVTTLYYGGRKTELENGEEESAPQASEGPSSGADDAAGALLLAAGALCNDAVLETEESGYRAVGDPTESALVIAAARQGLIKKELERALARTAEVPFESSRKRMTTVHRRPDSLESLPQGLAAALKTPALQNAEYVAFAKGAVDRLLEVCSGVWEGDDDAELDEQRRKQIVEAHDELAAQGMRILGMAVRPLDSSSVSNKEEDVERNLIFIGLAGMIDPPRPEVYDAIGICRTAGLRTLMITGDHPLTAKHIAAELGIGAGDGLLTGSDLEKLSPEQIYEAAQRVAVYARVSPEHKLDIVDALQDHGHIVAMTGDGVNDAPALKKADIGVAMGITGTDVSKEASDMVLRDDNFATIVAAVEEGRIIFDNIRKFIRYLLSANSGELWMMLAGPLMGMPLPLLPLQILWMNLITDGPPALALGVEPAEKDVMKRPPYPPQESVFGHGVARGIVWVGLLMGVVSLSVGFIYWQQGIESWQTMAFSTLTFSQLALALAIRSDKDSVFAKGLFSNRPMVAALLLSVVLQLGAIYAPFLQRFLETVPLEGKDLALSLALSTIVFWAVEIEKLLLRTRRGARTQEAVSG